MTQTSKQLEAQLAILNEQIAKAKEQESKMSKAGTTRVHRSSSEKMAIIGQTFGNKTITAVAKEHGIHPKLLGEWRLTALRSLDRKSS